ncbi:MAG: hypothetical protein M1836_005409 [Candelina mexicana]|nr:MAG: hypothetical protein M1836_005409 [Candelina mexicana]
MLMVRGTEAPAVPARGSRWRPYDFLPLDLFKKLHDVWRVDSEERPQFIIRTVEDHHVGYPRLGAYVDSDPNWNIYRRFGYLRNRSMLHKQAELASLEVKLQKLDDRDSKLAPEVLTSREQDDNQKDPRRKFLLKDIEATLKSYDDMLFRSQATLAMRKPSDRNVTSYWNEILNTTSLIEPEQEFILHKEDLVTLAGDQEDNWLNAFVERMMIRTCRRLTQVIFTTSEQKRKSTDPNIRYYSKSRLDYLIRTIITLIATAACMTPVFVLTSIRTDQNMKNLVALAFTFVFATLYTLFTHAKRHEVLTATAA